MPCLFLNDTNTCRSMNSALWAIVGAAQGGGGGGVDGCRGQAARDTALLRKRRPGLISASECVHFNLKSPLRQGTFRIGGFPPSPPTTLLLYSSTVLSLHHLGRTVLIVSSRCWRVALAAGNSNVITSKAAELVCQNAQIEQCTQSCPNSTPLDHVGSVKLSCGRYMSWMQSSPTASVCREQGLA